MSPPSSPPPPLWLALYLPPARPDPRQGQRPRGPASAVGEQERPVRPPRLDGESGGRDVLLACWAGGYTPRVSLAPPAGLLLEIGGCLRLWGGLETLAARLAADLAAQGLSAAFAAAPTPQAALWLSQGAPGTLCIDPADMRRQLDRLPLAALDLPAPAREKLERFGARTLADVRRLPAAGLARRLAPHGPPLVQAIARAYGEAPDPRPDFVFPERFAEFLELPAPVEAAGALLFAARRLTAALAGWLAVRQSGIDHCTLELVHSSREATHLVLRFAEATRDARRFERVLRERIERLALTAPVAALRLAADAVAPLAGKAGTLFGAAGFSTPLAVLLERLRARLGEERVHAIAPRADHRPECASRKVGAGDTAASAALALIAPAPRPFWLLERPEALAEVGGRPWRRGALRLLAGPERIESGWWDAGEEESYGDVRRDYFVALTADARWAWIFRELRAPGGWYLHGWFA